MSTTNNEEDLLLIEFFRQASAALESLCELYDGPAEALSDVRKIVLEKQTECLQTAITSSFSSSTDWTAQDLRQALGRCSAKQLCPTVQQSMERMNDAARLAFCRLVLHSECLYDSAEYSSSRRNLISSGLHMKHSDILEFCGLCLTSVRLPAVIEHLRRGTPLFENLSAAESRSILPQKRLERIQRMFLRALGYDPDYGTREIKRLFYDDGDSGDDQLRATFISMAKQMEAVLMEAVAAVTHETFFAEDNVTRVVSVAYSEKLIDEATGQEIQTVTEDAAPRAETMQEQDVDDDDDDDDSPELAAAKEQKRRDELNLARQAAVLQQEILGELLSMRDEERDAKLRTAKVAVDNVLQKAMDLPAGPERISYIMSLDPATQRLMAMQKLWDGMLAANGGKPPKVRTQQAPDY